MKGIWLYYIIIVLCLALILMSMVLLLVNALVGALGIFFGVAGIIYTRKAIKSKRRTQSVAINQPVPDATKQFEPPAPSKTEGVAYKSADTLRREDTGIPVLSKSSDTEDVVFKIAGTTYHEEGIMSLASENPDYSLPNRDIIDSYPAYERIYRYDFFCTDVSVEDEPDNPYDPKAICVKVGDVVIGHIKKGSTGRIRNLRKRGIKDLNLEIAGGKYKIVVEDDDREMVERDEAPLFARLTVTVSNASKSD